MTDTHNSLARKLRPSAKALLFSGWLSSIGFLFYAQGIFSTSYQWSGMDLVIVFYLVIFSIPYLILGMLFRSYQNLPTFLLLSTAAMIATSIYVYSSVYFPSPTEGAEWMFFLVPFFQTIFAIILTLILIFGQFAWQSWACLRERARSKPPSP